MSDQGYLPLSEVSRSGLFIARAMPSAIETENSYIIQVQPLTAHEYSDNFGHLMVRFGSVQSLYSDNFGHL